MHRVVLGFTSIAAGLALACETQSEPPPQPPSGLGQNQYPSQLTVTTPDSRTFRGDPARVQLMAGKQNVWEDKFSVYLGAESFAAVPGKLIMLLELAPDTMVTPRVLNVPIALGEKNVAQDGHWLGLGTAAVGVDNVAVPSGSVHLELDVGAARISGRVETPQGVYRIDGKYVYECLMWGIPQGGGHDQNGSPYALVSDDKAETALCQRFATLAPP